MVDTSVLIQQQRQAFATAKSSAKKPTYTQAELLKKRSMQEFAQRQAETGQVEKYKQDIEAQQAAFESDIAQRAPEYAEESYKAQALAEAKAGLEAKKQPIIDKIAYYEQRIKSYADDGVIDKSDKKAISWIEDKLNVLRSELRGYESTLGGDDTKVISGYFSGQAEEYASFLGNKEEARQANKEAKKAYDKEMIAKGFIPIKDGGITTGYVDPKGFDPSHSFSQAKSLSTSQLNMYSEGQKALENYQIKNMEAQGFKLVRGEQGQIVSFSNPEMFGKRVFANAEEYNKAVKEYNTQLSKQKVLYPSVMPNAKIEEQKQSFWQRLTGGGEITPEGLYTGTVTPVTAEDITTVAMPLAGLYKGGLIVGAKMFAAPFIKSGADYAYNVIPSPSSIGGKFGKAFAAGATVAAIPILSGSYAYEFMKSMIFNPIKTPEKIYESFKINPAENIGFVIGGLSGGAIKNKIIDFTRTYGKTPIIEPSYDIQPFMKQEGNINRQVYYERVPKLSVTNPKSWLYNIRGYKPGQFLQRQYRLTAPEVKGYYEGAKEVTYYDIEKGKIQQVTKKTTRFPTANPSQHFAYFMEKQPSKYYLPGGAGAEYRLGYSATPLEWTGKNKNTIGQNVPEYVSGKGVSQAFYRIGNVYSNVLNTPLFKTGQKPQLYAEYVKTENVVINPAQYEMRIPNPFGGSKPVKRYVLTNPEKSATFMIPKYKPEVEANVFGLRQPINTKYYYSIQGRAVPIQQSIIVPGGEGAIPKGLQALGTSYAPRASSSIITSASLIRSNILKTKNKNQSYIMSVPSYQSSIVPSYQSSIVPSYFSYTPRASPAIISPKPSKKKTQSYITSVPSYQSSIVPSYFSYTPSYAPSRPSYIPPSYSSKITPAPKPKLNYVSPKSSYTALSTKKLYDVLIRKKGKWLKIGSNLPEMRAKKLGATRVLSTLERSFRLEPTKNVGVDRDIAYNLPSNKFRIPKGKSILPRTTMVQINALGSKREVEKIMRAKIAKGGKKQKWW